MKIKKLEICGFKSFCDRTVITFPDPITAIVGPNGCGKSNVVDAIRWCMGEQSAKHLRGRSMEDVIFAGSETRGPAAFAEVSLTFETYAWGGTEAPGGVPWGQAAPSEVVVTRRLHRDGQSEYLLGGVPCRLRDIVDFFLGTGVGTKAYAIIEQGRVGFIVSSRPEDRRGLIDEAAGITKYKAKKRVAEKRMDATRQHLLRVSDIVGEIEARLRTLRLQAQKAERYKRYKAELRELELWSSSHRYLGLLAEEKALTGERAEVQDTHDAEAAALAINESETQTERAALAEEAAELAHAKDELFTLSNKAQLDLQRAEHYEDEAESLARQSDEAARERETLLVSVAEHTRSLEGLGSEIEALVHEAQTSAAAYAERERIYEGLRAELSTGRRALDEATQRASAARTRMARAESDRDATELRRQDLARRISGVRAEDASLEVQAAEAEREAEELRQRLAGIEARVAGVREQRQVLDGRAVDLRGEISRREHELDALREESHRRKSRLHSLQEIEERYESFQRGVRAIMQKYRGEGADGSAPASAAADGEGAAVRGVVADIMQPPPELETAVEAVLGERLGNVIVASADVGVEAIEFLKSKSRGRSSFIPVSLRRGAPTARRGEVIYDAGVSASGSEGGDVAFLPDVNEWPSGDGVRGPILELIGYDRQYDKVATYLLGDVLLVEDLRQALDLWRRTQTNKTIVTLDGEVIDPQGVVTGGSKESATAGVLSQKREIRELEQVVARVEADYETAMGKHVAVKQALTEVTEQLEDLQVELRAAEMDALGVRKDVDRAVREHAQLESRRTQLVNGVRDLERAADEASRRGEQLIAALEAERVTVAEADAASERLRLEVLAVGERLDAMVDELTTLKVAATTTEQRRAAAVATMERLRREKADQEARIERLGRAVEEQRTRLEVLRRDGVRLREEATLALGEADERARSHAEHQDQVDERNALLARREAEVRAARGRVNGLATRLSSLGLRCQEATLRRAALEEQVADRYADVRLSEIVHDFHLRAPVGNEEETRIVELRGLIDRMGEINLTAIEESEELQKRFDFLTTQRADLESAIAQLETAIEKINKASRERFQEVFDAVNAKFQDVYPRLFGGGRAHLRLTEDGDLLEKGVEIIANPPGKKIAQNIELLSGGEKALTAVSLLFAIFLVKPSPFCILDEVDAPLDEANVGRFNLAVREMTDRSQFIVITHNKRTMEIADRLCGVTMEEPGISKLVAVNLRTTRRDGGGSGERPATASEGAVEAPAAVGA